MTRTREKERNARAFGRHSKLHPAKRRFFAPRRGIASLSFATCLGSGRRSARGVATRERAEARRKVAPTRGESAYPRELSGFLLVEYSICIVL